MLNDTHMCENWYYTGWDKTKHSEAHALQMAGEVNPVMDECLDCVEGQGPYHLCVSHPLSNRFHSTIMLSSSSPCLAFSGP